MRTTRLVFLAVAAAAIACAQRDMTTFQTLFSLEGASPATSAAVRNIGQASHAAYVIFSNKPGQVCVAGVVDIGFEQSFNGVTWTRFGDQLAAIAVNADSQLATTIQAYGAFPRVRLIARSFDAVKCALTAHYAGSVAGQANITLTAGAMTVSNTPTVRPLTRIAYSVEYDSGLIEVPLVATTLTAANTLVHTLFCNNTTALPVSLTLVDNSGGALPYVSSYLMPANSHGALWNFVRPPLLAGLKWTAGGAGLRCQVVGLQQ